MNSGIAQCHRAKAGSEKINSLGLHSMGGGVTLASVTPMKRHWKVLTGLGLLLACLGAGLLHLATSEPEPMRAYNRITLGMTQQEIENAIGIPPGDYRITSQMSPKRSCIRTTGRPIDWRALCLSAANDEKTVQHWNWDNYWIMVAFDDDGKALGYYLFQGSGSGFSSGFFDWLRHLVDD